MTTKVIGIKEFRNNINSLWEEACKKQIRYVVMRHSVPIWEVNPIDEDALILEKFGDEILAAEKRIDNGEYTTHEELVEMLKHKKNVENNIRKSGQKRHPKTSKSNNRQNN
jgi:hypothetical protein